MGEINEISQRIQPKITYRAFKGAVLKIWNKKTKTLTFYYIKGWKFKSACL